MVLPETPKGLVLDGTLAAWGTLVFLKIVPALTGLAVLVLLILRIMISVREYRLKGRELGQ